jgi:hypothetical protein
LKWPIDKQIIQSSALIEKNSVINTLKGRKITRDVFVNHQQVFYKTENNFTETALRFHPTIIMMLENASHCR